MIYSEVSHFTPNIKSNKNNFTLIDLSVIQTELISEKLAELASNNAEELALLSSRFADTIIAPSDLNNKVNAVVLPFDAFIRQFKPVDQPNLYPSGLSPFQYLLKQYEHYLLIGLKVDLNDDEKMQELKKKNILKKLRLLSFDIHQSKMAQQMATVRRYIKQYANNKTQFHITLHMTSLNCLPLKSLKIEMIQHQYPLQYVILQTNLLNIIEMKYSLKLISDWEEIAFKYCQIIQKYVPIAISCLIQDYTTDKQLNSKQANALFLCLSFINKRNEKGDKQYKPYHSSGVVLLATSLMDCLECFTTEECEHFRVKGLIDSVYFKKMDEIMMGCYKTIQSPPSVAAFQYY